MFAQKTPAASAPRYVFRPGEGPCGDVLVVALLSGGMDGIHLVAPHADPEYFRQRPRLAPPEPGRTGGIVDLDGFYGLHPKLLPLYALFRSGELAVVHACGTPDQTLSHFEAMRALERGVANAGDISTGWVSRHLATHDSGNTSPLKAVAFSSVLPPTLAGTPGALTLRSLSDIGLQVPQGWGAIFQPLLAGLYADGNDAVALAGRQAFSLLQDLNRLRPEQYRPERGATYPRAKFGQDLKQVAQLIKAEVGLEAAVVELGGWDSHIRQAQLDDLMTVLAESLGAFGLDMGNQLRRVTVVAVSEFGRRVRENSALGTDHGRATAMFLLGGQVRGGRVYGRWPGLAPGQTDQGGNLVVTTDYRSVLAEIVQDRLKNPNTGRVFPNFNPSLLDVFPASP